MRDSVHRIYGEIPEARVANPLKIENELARIDRDVTINHSMLESKYGQNFKGVSALDGLDRRQADMDISRFNVLTDKKIKLERILDAIDLEEKYYGKMQGLMGEMSKALYKDIPGVNKWSDLKEIDAADFLSKNRSGKLKEVQKYFKEILRDQFPKPKKGDSLFKWTARLCEAIADHKNVRI
jgi:hypothetical protein